MQAGDPLPQEQVVRHAYALALRTAVGIVGERDQAGDIAQDVTIDVLRDIRRLRKPESLDAWVHRMTVRRSLRLLKRARRRGMFEAPLSALPFSRDSTTSSAIPERAADHAALREIAKLALEALPEKQRIALALRYVHDLSESEIAEAMECRPGTVGSLLSRARERLRRSPELRAFTDADD